MFCLSSGFFLSTQKSLCKQVPEVLMFSIRPTLFIGFDIYFFSQIYLMILRRKKIFKDNWNWTCLFSLKIFVGGSGFQSIKQVYYFYQLLNLYHLRFPSQKIIKSLIDMQLLVWEICNETFLKNSKQNLVLVFGMF